jgi:excisionase family DNA binding protein
MADMYYSLKQVSERLNIPEEGVRELVEQGRLREYPDGPNRWFKIDEVEALMSDTSFMAMQEQAQPAESPPSQETPPPPSQESPPPPQAQEQALEEEISVAPEAEAGKIEPAGDETTVSGQGISILGETDTEYKLADDTLGETKAVSSGRTFAEDLKAGTAKGKTGESSLEEIEGDVNLDTFGSGSGLLDLSLQADDTSLGGILDEIYTPEGEEAEKATPPAAASAAEVAAEAEELTAPSEEAPMPAEPLAAEPPAMVVKTYVEAAPDVWSGALGKMLWVPFAVVIYTAIIVTGAIKGVAPALRTSIQGLIWPIMGGAAVAALLVAGLSFMVGAPKGEKKPKVKKEKPPKKEKPKKEKKAKKEA